MTSNVLKLFLLSLFKKLSFRQRDNTIDYSRYVIDFTVNWNFFFSAGQVWTCWHCE